MRSALNRDRLVGREARDERKGSRRLFGDWQSGQSLYQVGQVVAAWWRLASAIRSGIVLPAGIQNPITWFTLNNKGQMAAEPLTMPQNECHEWFDLDLAVMEDEALVVLAQECDYEPARDELIMRYSGQTDRLIRWLAHNEGLSQPDIEDARQAAVFSIVEAVKKYDTNQIGKPRGCSFRSFIYRVRVARFKDYLKHFRRVEGHYDRTIPCEADDASRDDIDSKLTDPASIAEAHESITRLEDALVGLDSESDRLWRLLADGNSLRQIATQLEMSYDSVKRRRRKLIEQLKLRLKSAP